MNLETHSENSCGWWWYTVWIFCLGKGWARDLLPWDALVEVPIHMSKQCEEH